jgi:putative transcription factor
MQCEICGKEIHKVKKAKIEGSILTVCEDCAKLGTEVHFAKYGQPSNIKPQTSYGSEIDVSKYVHKVKPFYMQSFEDFEINEDYPKLIRQAREQKGMKRKDFAMMLQERESVIEKLESGRMLPDQKLAKKLERKLGIRLLESA